MSRQHRKTEKKTGTKRNRPDSRVQAEQSAEGYIPNKGDTVVNVTNLMLGAGKVTSASYGSGQATVYWPRRDTTTVVGFHHLREKKTEHHLETIQIEEGLWVTHRHHSEFGVGHVLFQHQNAGGFINLYKVRWKFNTERDHKAELLRPYKGKKITQVLTSPHKLNEASDMPVPTSFEPGDEAFSVGGRSSSSSGRVIEDEGNGVIAVDWGNDVRRRESFGSIRHTQEQLDMAEIRVKGKAMKVKPEKDPNPNRAFRSTKVRGRRQSFYDSPHTRFGRTSTSTRPPMSVAEPARRPSTVLQRTTLRNLMRQKGINDDADLYAIGYTAANMLIGQWERLPDEAPQAEPRDALIRCHMCGEPCREQDTVSLPSGEYYVCSDSCSDQACIEH